MAGIDGEQSSETEGTWQDHACKGVRGLLGRKGRGATSGEESQLMGGPTEIRGQGYDLATIASSSA